MDKTTGRSGDEATTAIAISTDGSIYTTGSSNGSLLDHVNQGGKDTLTAKYSTNGTLIWADLIGSSSFERARGITIGSYNYIYIIGNFDQNFDGNTGSGNGDAFITKYSSNGSKISTNIFGTNSYHSGESITADTSGSL